MKACFSFSGILITFFSSFPGLDAQPGTNGDGSLLKLLLPDGSVPLFENKEGGYGYAEFGAEVIQEMEGEVAWAHTTAGDSLCCVPVANDLTGKFALVRRGICNFSQKCFFAQKNGAEAVIVLNHYDLFSNDENTIVNMPTGINGDSVTIPCIFVCRKVGELITNAVDNGQPVTARFVFRSLEKATAAYHYATPLSQVDTLKHITVHFFNPTFDTLFDATVNATITEPGGNIVNLSVPVERLAPKQDTLLFFPPYLPSAVTGEFDVIFFNSAFGESEDKANKKFKVTEHTWASDNEEIVPGGIPWDFSDIFPAPTHFQPGTLYRTGATGGKVSHAIFGLADADRLVLHGDYAIGIVLYDADANEDGVIDFLETPWPEWENLTPVGCGLYQVTGEETDDSLIATPVKDIITCQDTLFLKPRHFYYLSFINDPCYAGSEMDLSKFSITKKEHYHLFPSSPTQIQSTFYMEAFTNFTIIQRLALGDSIEPVVPTDNFLFPSKFSLYPNPASFFLQLDLDLSSSNETVAVSLLDPWGRKVASETRTNFRQGTITIDMAGLPSGAYLLWIRTEEGHAMRKVMICH